MDRDHMVTFSSPSQTSWIGLVSVLKRGGWEQRVRQMNGGVNHRPLHMEKVERHVGLCMEFLEMSLLFALAWVLSPSLVQPSGAHLACIGLQPWCWYRA